MTWDWLVQRTGKYCSIRRMEYPEFQTGIFGRMESAPNDYNLFTNNRLLLIIFLLFYILYSYLLMPKTVVLHSFYPFWRAFYLEHYDKIAVLLLLREI